MAACEDRFEYKTDISSLSDYDSDSEWTQVSGAKDDSDFPPLSAASERSASLTGTVAAGGSNSGDAWDSGGLLDELQRYPSDFSSDGGPSASRAATGAHDLDHLDTLRSSVATYDVGEVKYCQPGFGLQHYEHAHNSLTKSHFRLRRTHL